MFIFTLTCCGGSHTVRRGAHSFSRGTVFIVGGRAPGALIYDPVERVYDRLAKAVASVIEKPISAVAWTCLRTGEVAPSPGTIAHASIRGLLRSRSSSNGQWETTGDTLKGALAGGTD